MLIKWLFSPVRLLIYTISMSYFLFKEYPVSNYVDTALEQIIVYSKEKITEQYSLLIIGKVIAVPWKTESRCW